jgi:hypothetical protein
MQVIGQYPDVTQPAVAFARYCDRIRSLRVPLPAQHELDFAFAAAMASPQAGAATARLLARLDSAAAVAAAKRFTAAARTFPRMAEDHFDAETAYLRFASEELASAQRPGMIQPGAPKPTALGQPFQDWRAIRGAFDDAVSAARTDGHVFSDDQAEDMWNMVTLNPDPAKSLTRVKGMLAKFPRREKVDASKPVGAALAFAANESTSRLGRRMAAACTAPRAAVPTRSAAASSPPAMEPVAAALSTAATEATSLVGELMARAALGF